MGVLTVSGGLLRGVALVGLAAALAGAGGCRSAYDVQVRNMTDQPIVAALSAPFGDGADKALAVTRLGPGDRGSLFRQVDSKTRVALRVDFAGNEGTPAVMDLVRGETVVNVERVETPSVPGAGNQPAAGALSIGRLRLREVSSP